MSARARSTVTASAGRPTGFQPGWPLALAVLALAILAVRFFRPEPETSATMPSGQPGREMGLHPSAPKPSVRVEAAAPPVAAPPRDFAREAAIAIAEPVARRRDDLNTVYFEWGRHDPELAVESALRIEKTGWRAWALESALSGWAKTAPGDLADAALAFPEGNEKRAALTKAIRAWLVADPDRAGDWIKAHPATIEIAETIIRTKNR